MPSNMFDKRLNTCILCHSANIKSNLVDHRGINIDICNDCGFQFMNPQYSDNYLHEYYSEYTHDDDYQRWREPTLYGHGYYLSLIEKYAQPGSLFDIGCGNGILMEAAKSRGWSIRGYDVDEISTSRVSDRLGVPVYNGDFLSCKPEQSFDVVVMHQVLEHIKDPNEYLNKAKTLLKENGYLFIAVPNIKSLSNRIKRLLETLNIRRKNIGKYYDTTHHILYFEPNTLKKLLQNHGFVVLYKRNCHTVRPRQSALHRFIARNITDHLFSKSAFLFIAKLGTRK